MKKLSLLILFASFAFFANAQTTPSKASAQKIEKKAVEVACGECMFKMPGKGCDLAIKIDGATYFVDGRKIDDFGDAHADDGFCNAIKKAEVIGEVKDGKFVVSYFKLLPNSTKK